MSDFNARLLQTLGNFKRILRLFLATFRLIWQNSTCQNNSFYAQEIEKDLKSLVFANFSTEIQCKSASKRVKKGYLENNLFELDRVPLSLNGTCQLSLSSGDLLSDLKPPALKTLETPTREMLLGLPK